MRVDYVIPLNDHCGASALVVYGSGGSNNNLYAELKVKMLELFMMCAILILLFRSAYFYTHKYR